MDGIKPTIADLNDDQGQVYDAVKVDLLHPAGPSELEPTVSAARVAPITPPFHAAPESNVEIVKNTPPPPPEPLPVEATPVPDPVPTPPPAPVVAPLPAPVAQAAPVVSTPSDPPPAPSRLKKGPIIAIIVLLLLVAGGGAYYYFVYHKKPVAQAPAPLAVTAGTPTNLSQADTKGSLAKGGTTNTPPTLGASLETTANTGSVALEVEVEPMGTAFTGAPTATGETTKADGSALTLSVNLKSLPAGSYHWQARTEVGSATSAWVLASPNDTTTPDFIVSTAAPTAPTVSAVAGGSVTGTTATTTQNQPQLSGTTAAGSSLSILVTPDNITLTPTVTASGSWTVTPSQQLSNGNHTLALTTTDAAGNHSQASYTLTVNPVVTSTTPPPSTPSTPNVATTTPATTAPAPAVNTTKLAPTGDSTEPLTLIALAAALSAVAGLVYLRRYDRQRD